MNKLLNIMLTTIYDNLKENANARKERLRLENQQLQDREQKRRLRIVAIRFQRELGGIAAKFSPPDFLCPITKPEQIRYTGCKIVREYFIFSYSWRKRSAVYVSTDEESAFMKDLKQYLYYYFETLTQDSYNNPILQQEYFMLLHRYLVIAGHDSTRSELIIYLKIPVSYII